MEPKSPSHSADWKYFFGVAPDACGFAFLVLFVFGMTVWLATFFRADAHDLGLPTNRQQLAKDCVSLKDSDPQKVIEVNRCFAEKRPEVPLHLGVTEADMPPDGIIKTRIAFEQLISRGIGDTIRVSLTVSNPRKPEEISAGRAILADIAAGRVRSVVDFGLDTLNIISCPSCSRVECV